jgi:alkanesulfonate monooxygenase SsuD/methylene tetrahydromethanopterin reductase-like flavin-dependent oxidoreductase (luciferase family)
LRVPIYVGEDEKSARAEPEQSIMQFYRKLAVQVQDSATRPGARASERRAERGQALGAVTYEEALRGKVIIGTPDSVTARLKELIEIIGLDGVLAELNCGGMIPDEKVDRSLRLMCQEVAPRFR